MVFWHNFWISQHEKTLGVKLRPKTDTLKVTVIKFDQDALALGMHKS